MTLAADHFKPGDDVYLPFWIVLDSLDATPPTPFIKCTVINLGPRTSNSPHGSVDYMACDLELGKPGLIAPGIPVDYLIKPANLESWAVKIANWFMDYPKTAAGS